MLAALHHHPVLFFRRGDTRFKRPNQHVRQRRAAVVIKLPTHDSAHMLQHAARQPLLLGERIGKPLAEITACRQRIRQPGCEKRL